MTVFVELYADPNYLDKYKNNYADQKLRIIEQLSNSYYTKIGPWTTGKYIALYLEDQVRQSSKYTIRRIHRRTWK